MSIKLDTYVKIFLFMAILVNCSNCGAEVYKSPCFVKKSKNLFCGNECRISFMKGSGTGEDNPNFGKKWDDERKKRQSEIIKSRVNDEYRSNCSKGKKGKVVDEKTKEKRRETLIEKYGKLSNNTKLSEEVKKIIGKKSSEKFTKEFKDKQYKTMVERGIWIRKEEKDPYHFYRELSNWKCNVLAFDVKGSEKAMRFGFYNYKNNREGLVRDHRYSRLSGFKELIFPEILRHPFNCEFITLDDNARKHHSKKISSDSITIEELFEGIKTYSKNYEEQLICLEKIKQYEQGFRYNSKDYF